MSDHPVGDNQPPAAKKKIGRPLKYKDGSTIQSRKQEGYKNTRLDVKSQEVEWRGYLWEETSERAHEVAMGWCEKGKHYIAWHLRQGHVEECQWRNSKWYGK
jgi:hypothetical protein